MKSSTKQTPAERALAFTLLGIGHFVTGWAVLALFGLAVFLPGGAFLWPAFTVLTSALWPISTWIPFVVGSFGWVIFAHAVESLLFAALVIWLRPSTRFRTRFSKGT